MRSIVIYCPHLDRDLRPLCEAVPEMHIYLGAQTPNGADGCLESHKAVIREAMELGEERLFVMEDDCQFTQHFDLNRWEEDAMWAQEHGYDVLCGGSTRTYDSKVVREGIIEVSAFHSAHCVVYLKSGYEKALNAIQPYDVSLGQDCQMRCALVWPFVAVQKPSFSGILQKPVDYVPLYHDHEKHLAVRHGLTKMRWVNV